MKNLAFFDKFEKLHINNPAYRKQVDTLMNFFLETDGIDGDVSTKLLKNIVPDTLFTASIVAKQSGIVAGIEESVYILSQQSSIKIEKKVDDGLSVEKNSIVMQLHGNYRDILTLERTVLNLLQRMSGIATETNLLNKRIDSATRIAATRKTLWGWLDKKAVAVGGGLTHRLSLADGVLIKDNHVDLLSKNKTNASREKALEQILFLLKDKELAEIEVISYEEAIFVNMMWKKMYPQKTLIIMLDNFSIPEAKKTIEQIKCDNIVIELSGGIHEDNIQEYGSLGADIISLGALTHSSRSLDMSLGII